MKTAICIDKDNNTHEVPVSELSWRPSVYAIIMQDDQILLVPQWGDGYDLPGGGIELGETLEEALIREVKEETGLDIIFGRVLDTQISFFKMHAKANYAQCVLIYASAKPIGGTLSADGFGKEEREYARMAEWVPISEVKNLKFYSSIDLITIIQKVIS